MGRSKKSKKAKKRKRQRANPRLAQASQAKAANPKRTPANQEPLKADPKTGSFRTTANLLRAAGIILFFISIKIDLPESAVMTLLVALTLSFIPVLARKAESDELLGQERKRAQQLNNKYKSERVSLLKKRARQLQADETKRLAANATKSEPPVPRPKKDALSAPSGQPFVVSSFED